MEPGSAGLSSHIVTDVEQACDRIVVLAAGRVVLDGSVAVPLDHYSNAYSFGFCLAGA